MKMELLKLSKFKLQLQALVTEVRYLRERERSATGQCQVLLQKQKQTEEEYGRKLQELQNELASSNELQQKLERKVSYVQNDNALLENKQKELKGTIQCLLQSRDSFVNAYEESTCEMRRSIEARDRKINVLTEKINSHLLLFESIEKEAFCVKQVVDNVQHLVSEKEAVVAGLRSKMDGISAFEKGFLEKMCDMENKLKNNEDELRKKDRTISELEARLEAAKISDNFQNQIEELQKIILAKDAVIQNLVSEKEALHCEVGSLTIVLCKIQETVTTMGEKVRGESKFSTFSILLSQDRKVFSSVLECQDCDVVMANDDKVIVDVVKDPGETFPVKSLRTNSVENQAASKCQEQNSVHNLLQDENRFSSCVSKEPCSELQSVSNCPSNSLNEWKVSYIAVAHQLDSECSTTQAETSEDPGREES